MLKDTGKRTEYESGAIREMAKGKGRPSLMPLDIIDKILNEPASANCFENIKHNSQRFLAKSTLTLIDDFQKTRNTNSLLFATTQFIDIHFDNRETAILELSKHFEAGAEKYSDNNWKLGIPEDRYIDGAVRHYLKFKRGDTDESHDVAFIWNIVCLIWTVENEDKLKELK